MNGNILDTNVIIEFLNGNEKVRSQLKNISDFAIPITVLGELLIGAEYSKIKEKDQLLYESFCSSFPIINTTIPIARKYAEITAQLKKKGHPIPMNDVWIAASAMANGMSVVTSDNHFKFIDGLDVIEIQK